MNKHFAIFMKYATQNIPNCYSYKFEIIKELNDYYVAPEKLPLSFEQQYPRAIKNSRIALNRKNDLLNKEASLLINLNDETESQVGTKPSISSTNNGKLTGKYSEDLLSLNLDANQSENDSKTVVGNKDFQNEMDKCVSFLDSIIDQPPLQTNTSDLQFWSLMTNYVNSKDSSLKSYNFLENASGGDSVNAKLSHLENVLTEFDPFSFCKSTCMKRNGINESC
ncbi:islet cell autoantigen 1 [Caerostris extrusa]|uniref:Islet cell autoantigen 1 n=1 Tax=Caerostris extrusa TaxID=172846 RepID=A0AAV4P6T1_CAEEX|nr:islet cell autoantigen 1 [Caerostris extrusa]